MQAAGKAPAEAPRPPLPVRPASASRTAGRAWRDLVQRLRRAGGPRARPALQLAVLAALLAVGIWGLLSAAAGASLRDLEQHRSEADTAALDVSSVAQSFVPTRPGLSSVQVELGTYISLAADGRFRLLRGEGLRGDEVYTAPLSKGDFSRNPYLEISFPPVSDSQGVTFTLVVETSGRPLNTAVGLRYSGFDTLTAGALYLDGSKQPGDLAFSAYYHYGPRAVAADFLGAIRGSLPLVVSWLALLFLPGLALLLWLPNTLTAGQRTLAAPGVSVLALPVLMLLARAAGIPVSTFALWAVLLLCASVIGLWVARHRTQLGPFRIDAPAAGYWSLLTAVTLLTLAGRLMSIRDALAGMGLDAYHHTLITQMFVLDGGIPQNYQPFAPLASFTYHFGFHALAAAVAWLSGLTAPTDVLYLMPQAGQVATTLPVLTLALFGWRCLGDRWAGLAAGTLAGLVGVFPAYFVNWSRYTQGLGLALLPVAWLLLLEAAKHNSAPLEVNGGRVAWRSALNVSGPVILAVIGAAGLFLTHYRIAIIYAVFAALYLLWAVPSGLRGSTADFRARFGAALSPLVRVAAVAVVTLAALSPWLVNLSRNFGTRFVGKVGGVSEGYYSLDQMVGRDLLFHPSTLLMAALTLGGLVWAFRRRDPLPVLPALVWVVLGLWSNPYLLPVRLPYAGYLDATTVATGAWLPLSLLAGLTLSRAAAWVRSLGDPGLSRTAARAWRIASTAGMTLALLAGGAATLLATSSWLDMKPYVASGDLAALTWMRQNLPRDALVLANPFAFPWDKSPTPAIQGSDAGLWAPLVAGVASTVPPIPAYNERLARPDYLERVREVINYEPFENSTPDWDALRKMGVTHIYVGSRGGALSLTTLLRSDHAVELYHRDAAWVFALR